MPDPINNINHNKVPFETFTKKSSPTDSISIMMHINDTNSTNEQNTKNLIQKKKERIEFLKQKMSPKRDAVITGAATVAGGAILGGLANSFLALKGISLITLSGIATMGVAGTLGIAIGFLGGKLIANYHENKCQNEIDILQKEIQELESQLGTTDIEI